ncbi:class I SAM-dependent methyltransferase [Nocardioides sp. W7]|uniref:class I SAM-dependent methyltransferase n=1 Tax=Nocardioides sp. W7 TaxID=2931390 RepID=UPI001FD3849F|nr:class I SAM-dependent methyltransferase [Nocardioides sp. W7]
MDTGDFAYTGCDNLEVMQDAVRYNRFLVDSVLQHVTPGARVLDFGAGAGTYADMMREHGVSPFCLEPDPTLQAKLRANGYEVLDDDALRSQADSFDVIYTLNVLEHIKNDQEAAEDLAVLLKPGGRLVVYVPALEMLYSSMDTKVEHYRRYRRKPLERILRNAGLDITDSLYCDPIGFFATLAYKARDGRGSDDGSIPTGALKFYDRALFPLSRALHPVTGKVFGKNVLMVATKRT